MAGLIPLLLTPASGSRSSVVVSSPSAQTFTAQQQQHPPRSTQSPRPKRMLKRFSQQLPSTLLVLPYTAADWKKTIAEVKRMHSARRFRQCSVRCCEILDNIKNAAMVEPAYLIYLHFYAASSFEMNARPLLVTHAFRVKLLEQARHHYGAAASLIQAAEDDAIAKSRASSSASSIFSHSNFGGHSPSGSVSSRAGTPSTEISSPSCPSSLFLPPGPPPSMAAPSPPIKKKVAFFMPVPDEPIIRPDSPTLGFDDLITSEILNKELPPLPKQPARTSILKQARQSTVPSDTTSYQHWPRQSSVSSLASSAGTLTTSSLDGSPVGSAHHSVSSSLDFSFVYRSLGRYCTHLDSLRSQVAFHIAAVDRELTTCTHSPTFDPSTLRPSSSLSVHRSTDGSRPTSRSSNYGRPSSRASASGDGMPVEELTARIERLREQGWKRKRFDPKRYEVLREAVLEELAAEES